MSLVFNLKNSPEVNRQDVALGRGHRVGPCFDLALRSTLGVATALVLFGTAPVLAATYVLDKSHLEVGFSVKHLMFSNVKGRFDTVAGTFEFDPKTKVLKDIVVDVDTASVSTNDADRDKHLKGPDFFSVDKFPKMTFKADTGTLKISNGTIKGKLTILDKTEEVTLNVKYNGEAEFMGTKRVGFSATTKIDRKKFGMNWNKNLDKGGLAVGNEVIITIDGEAVLKDPEKVATTAPTTAEPNKVAPKK